MGRRSWPPRTSRSSAATTRPTSTRCSSATSPTASPAAATSSRPPAKIAQPRTAQVKEIQERLIKLGYELEKIDGKIGSNTRRQVGTYQKKNGLKIDCWPTDAVLSHLRATAALAVTAQ